MYTKQDALDVGISEEMWDKSVRADFVLIQVKPTIRWERRHTREARRALIEGPIKAMLGRHTPSHEAAIAIVVDEIMTNLDRHREEHNEWTTTPTSTTSPNSH